MLASPSRPGEGKSSRFQASQERVYGGGEASDFVFRVSDGQAPREIPLRHLVGCPHDCLHGGEGGSGQEVRHARHAACEGLSCDAA